MPQDIHPSLWKQVEATVTSGILAVTREIYDELEHLPGSIGDCIRAHRDLILLELGDSSWPWADYRVHARRMQVTRRAVISEYNRNRKNTVGLNDVSIVALAKALHLPVISMEKRSVPPSDTKCRIPDLCSLEGVEHLSFNDFLRKEGIRS